MNIHRYIDELNTHLPDMLPRALPFAVPFIPKGLETIVCLVRRPGAFVLFTESLAICALLLPLVLMQSIFVGLLERYHSRRQRSQTVVLDGIHKEQPLELIMFFIHFLAILFGGFLWVSCFVDIHIDNDAVNAVRSLRSSGYFALAFPVIIAIARLYFWWISRDNAQ